MITLREYIENYFKITSKDGKLIPLKMNSSQEHLYETFRTAYNEERPIKIIILKARQMGFSTMTEAIISAVSMTTPYVSSLIMAHDTESTMNIYRMTKRYYDNLPVEIKPMSKYNNARILQFENPSNDDNEKAKNPGLRSSIRVASAEQFAPGRGSTFQYMHLSELAFWKEKNGKTVEDQLTGLLQTLPQHGQSMLVIESTANGYNYFKKLWDQAVAGESDYIPLFFPWYQMPEYSLKYHNETLTPEEIELKERFDLTNGQLMWRRFAIRTLCGGSIEKFKQEYPSTPEEAFILTGSPFFNTQKIISRLESIPHPIRKGSYSDKGNFYEDENGTIEIWEEPIKGHVYAIGADTAGEGSDFFVAYLADKNTGKQVAKFRSQVDEKDFVRQIFFLGYEYNEAMIALETNYSTYPTLALQEMGYTNLYVREAVDTYTHRVQKKFGFRTTTITRPLMLDELKAIVNETPELISDEMFFHEALSFVKNESGKPEASTGSHDDCVMAMAILYHCMPQAQEPIVEDDEQFIDQDIQDFILYGC